LVALKNYVARIHGTGIKKAVVPEFNHEKTPAPQQSRVLHKLLAMASGEGLTGPRYMTIS